MQSLRLFIFETKQAKICKLEAEIHDLRSQLKELRKQWKELKRKAEKQLPEHERNKYKLFGEKISSDLCGPSDSVKEALLSFERDNKSKVICNNKREKKKL